MKLNPYALEERLRRENALSWLDKSFTLGAIHNLLTKFAPVKLVIRTVETTETTRTLKISFAGRSVKVQLSIID